MAIASLILGILGLPTVGLVLIGAMLGIVLGVVALVKARNAPAEYGGKGMAVAGIALCVISIVVMPFVLGIVAAIAIPSFLRARVSANESAAMGDMRSVLAAESAYQPANAGYYDTLECVAAPSRCIPGYSGAALLDGALATTTEKSGYRRTFHAGPPPSMPDPSRPVSPSSMTAFAYVAVPVQPGKTGVRSFCVDASGVRAQADGSEPEVVEGACPTDWERVD